MNRIAIPLSSIGIAIACAFLSGCASMAGVGSAMNRLANYYISLAEKVFPVIEIDAGRMVDVVLTRGVVIDAPLTVGATAVPSANRSIQQGRLQRTTHDEDDD